MNVAMGGQGTDAFLVAQSNAGFGRHFADASERQVGELFLPRIEQRHRFSARQGKEQFEVFPIGERGEQWRLGGGFCLGLKLGGATDGNGGLEQFGT